MKLEIKKYHPHEVPAILALLARCFPDAWAPLIAAGQRELAYRSESIVAVLDGKIVGNCGLVKTSIELERQSVVVAGIGSVAVDPDFRGMGIAKKMLTAGLENMKREGIGLSPLFTDKPAVYEPLGWHVCPLNPSLLITGELTGSAGNLKIVSGCPAADLLTAIMNVYDHGLWFDGKVVRTKEYWHRRVLQNLNNDVQWILLFDHDKLISYGLLAGTKNGTYFLSEAYALPSRENDFRTLLAVALKLGKGCLTVTLPSEHPLTAVISASALAVTPGGDIYGEVLMMNDLVHGKINNSFYWPYADKF